MPTYILNALAACLLLLLSGCQSDATSPMSSSMNPIFGPFSSSTNLTQSVQDALYRTGDPILSQVHVETNQNTVILTGYVKKIRQSDTAEQIAHQVPGVQMVQNNLIVRQ
jgi:osmotically-inducible protein OsmY